MNISRFCLFKNTAAAEKYLFILSHVWWDPGLGLQDTSHTSQPLSPNTTSCQERIKHWSNVAWNGCGTLLVIKQITSLNINLWGINQITIHKLLQTLFWSSCQNSSHNQHHNIFQDPPDFQSVSTTSARDGWEGDLVHAERHTDATGGSYIGSQQPSRIFCGIWLNHPPPLPYLKIQDP